MKAARIHGPKSVTYDTVDDPIIKENRDVILKVTATAIWGRTCIFTQAVCHSPGPWYWATSLWAL